MLRLRSPCCSTATNNLSTTESDTVTTHKSLLRQYLQNEVFQFQSSVLFSRDTSTAATHLIQQVSSFEAAQQRTKAASRADGRGKQQQTLMRDQWNGANRSDASNQVRGSARVNENCKQRRPKIAYEMSPDFVAQIKRRFGAW